MSKFSKSEDLGNKFSAQEARNLATEPRQIRDADYCLKRVLNLVKNAAKNKKNSLDLKFESSVVPLLNDLGYTVIIAKTFDDYDQPFVAANIRWAPDPLTPKQIEINAYLEKCKKNGVTPRGCSICDRYLCDRDH